MNRVKWLIKGSKTAQKIQQNEKIEEGNKYGSKSKKF